MKLAIRFFTQTGNTKKLADAIGEELGLEAKTIESNLEEKVDILFLGSSVYAASLAKEVKKFLIDNKDNIGEVVCFSTAALLKSTYKGVKKVCDKNGIKIATEEFHCKGSFGALNKNRPNDEDCKNVKEFAKKMANR